VHLLSINKSFLQVPAVEEGHLNMVDGVGVVEGDVVTITLEVVAMLVQVVDMWTEML